MLHTVLSLWRVTECFFVSQAVDKLSPYCPTQHLHFIWAAAVVLNHHLLHLMVPRYPLPSRCAPPTLDLRNSVRKQSVMENGHSSALRMMNHVWGHGTTYRSFTLVSLVMFLAYKHFCSSIPYIVACGSKEAGHKQNSQTSFSSYREFFYPISVKFKLVGRVGCGWPIISGASHTSCMPLCLLEKWVERDILFCERSIKKWVQW